MLERIALGGTLTRDQQVEAVAAIWLRTIYGTLTRRGRLRDPRAAHLRLHGVACDAWHFPAGSDDARHARPVDRSS